MQSQEEKGGTEPLLPCSEGGGRERRAPGASTAAAWPVPACSSGPWVSSTCLTGITARSFLVGKEQNGGAACEVFVFFLMRAVWKGGGRKMEGGGEKERKS